MTFDIQQYKEKLRNFIENYHFINTNLQKISTQIKIDKEYIFIGILGIIGILIFLIFGTSLIVDVVGFLYPLYASLKAIESPDAEDDKQWLTYWIIFTQFKIVESVADVLISFIPFYFFIKIAFLIWCYHPSFNGATVLYDAIIKEHVVPALGINAHSVKQD